MPDMEASTADQVLPMIAHNLGIGFYPEKLACDAINSGKVLPIPLAEEIPTRDICLIFDKSRPLSIAVQKLIKEFKA